jgi:hypothetical protein
MYKERYLSLLDKANVYVDRLTSFEYTPDGKAAIALLYQIDTMIYGLSTINSSVWQGYLKTLKESKQLLRIHSKDENLKKENYEKATTVVLGLLGSYIAYLQETLEVEAV